MRPPPPSGLMSALLNQPLHFSIVAFDTQRDGDVLVGAVAPVLFDVSAYGTN
mgnify:CR=1 FL=1